MHNKIDLTQHSAEIQYQIDPHVYISAKHGEGVDLLKTVLLESVGMQDLGENAFTARTRHLKTISLVADYLDLSKYGPGKLNPFTLIYETEENGKS